MKTGLLSATITALALAACAQIPADKGIGYPTYEAAFGALMANPDAEMKIRSDFIIFDDTSNSTLWFFTQPSNEFHPAVIQRKRIAVRTNNQRLISPDFRSDSTVAFAQGLQADYSPAIQIRLLCENSESRCATLASRISSQSEY